MLCLALFPLFMVQIKCLDFFKDFSNDWAVYILTEKSHVDQIAFEHGFRNLGQIASLKNVYHFSHLGVNERWKRQTKYLTRNLRSDPRVLWVEQQEIEHAFSRDLRLYFNDPHWRHQWYLNTDLHPRQLLDMNIAKAWQEGYTGEGVIISCLDDGIHRNHPDLKENFDPTASFDFLNYDYDPSPHKSSHGTRLAGIAAASANNSECIVGVAYGAQIGGIKMLSTFGISRVRQAQALSYGTGHVDIYIASWGPSDDAKSMGSVSTLTQWTLQAEATVGRQGRGAIYLWAAGNGGGYGDHCGWDGYVNSIYTVAVTSANGNGDLPWYNERCSAILTSAITNKNNIYHFLGELVTTDLTTCVKTRGATSTAVPIVAGIIALGLQAKSTLTWRDIQHLIVRSSKSDDMTNAVRDWKQNGAGRTFSHWYGFGLLDALRFVTLAKRWKSVPIQKICFGKRFALKKRLSGRRPMTKYYYTTSGCNRRIQYSEHVVLAIKVSYQKRGSFSVYLTSPMGTRSLLAGHRWRDKRRMYPKTYEFLSVHYWGENPIGEWKMEIRLTGESVHKGYIYNAQLIFHGTTQSPQEE